MHLVALDHESLISVDTLRPEDRVLLRAIFKNTAEGRARPAVKQIRAYYRDNDRAKRTPLGVLYLHLGIAVGVALDEGER